ncbi:MAG: class I SAM-dependent methyltransferase [Shewanella sp.]
MHCTDLVINKFNDHMAVGVNELPPTLPKSFFKEHKFSFADSYSVRCRYTDRIGWFILTTEVKEVLVNFLLGKRVLEVGSGTGYFAAHMKQGGVEDYNAVDIWDPHYWDERTTRYFGIDGDSLDYINSSYDVIVMNWPPYAESFAHQVVKKMCKGQVLVFEGEGSGGCTGDDDFFNYLDEHFTSMEELDDELNEHHIRFPGINDHWWVYVKTS